MRVLVIRFSSFGDCVLLCPLLERIRRSGVDEVAVLTKPAYMEIFACARGVDRVIATDGSPQELWNLLPDLSARDYTVVDAHASLRSRMVSMRLGGAAAQIRKHTGERLRLIVFKQRRALPTMLERYADLATSIGIKADALAPGGLDVSPLAAARAAEALPVGEPFVAMAPGSRWQSKRWNGFEEVARALVARGNRILLVGDARERAVIDPMAAVLGERCVNLAGRAGVMETSAHLARCRVLVGNDSGLMHLAEAVGVPVVALFGPTVREFGYYPSLPASRTVERELACRPCSRNGATPCPKGNHECLARIAPGVVIDAVTSLLDDNTPRRIVME